LAAASDDTADRAARVRSAETIFAKKVAGVGKGGRKGEGKVEDVRTG